MVIGVNHDGTENTVDLMSLVWSRQAQWNSSANGWANGRYTTSSFYSWISDTCPNGYSANIQAKMVNMTERWREATGNATGTLQTRQTKCKLLNPVELCGSSAASYSETWQYASTSDYKTDFDSKYGSLYPVWTDSIGALSNRRVFSDLAMSSATVYWTNSWFALSTSGGSAYCFLVTNGGNVNGGSGNVTTTHGVAPVIRLSQSPS